MAALSEPQQDPRGVRVSLVGFDAASPMVVEPPKGDRGDDGRHQVIVDGTPVEAELSVVAGARAVLRGGADPASSRVLLLPPISTSPSAPGISRREVVVDGWRFELEIESASRAALRERASRVREDAGHSGPLEVHAIIPGVVVALSVAPGDAVVAGQQLLVIEAMKMQNELRAPRDGTVERIAVGPGKTIEVGDLLLVLS